MSDAPENPYRSPETELRPPRSLAMLRQRIFGAVAFVLGVQFALSTLSSVARIVLTKTEPRWGWVAMALVCAGLTYWLIRLGRREWKAGKP